MITSRDIVVAVIVAVMGLGLSGLPVTARASESYESATRRIAERNSQIEKSLKAYRTRLGLPAVDEADTASSHSESHSHAQSDQAKTPLIQIHNPWVTAQLRSGRLLFGKTLQRLVVSSEPAPCLLELDSDQGPLSGVRVQGVARPSSTEGRMQMELSRILFSAKTVGFSGVALDERGALGVPAEVFSQKAWMVAGAMAGSFLSGLASAQTTYSTGAFGLAQPNVSPRNSILGGLAQTGADQSKRLIEEATSEKPILVVEAGTSVVVFVNEEVTF